MGLRDFFKKDKKEKKEKKDVWAEEYRAMNKVEETFEADKKKADEELEAKAKARLEEQEKAAAAEKKQQDQVDADVEVDAETKVDAEIKADVEAEADAAKADADTVKTDADIVQAKVDADADAEVDKATKPAKSSRSRSNKKKDLTIGEDYLVRDVETGNLVSKKTWEEAIATSAADAYKVKVWKEKDGSIKRALSVKELIEHFSKSKYPGKRKAFCFWDEGILRVMPWEEIYPAMQAVNFEKSMLTPRRVEYNEKGEFVRFADIPAPPATT